jgi:universal stress protein A
MLPFKKILCPTDFSEPSFKAIKAAAELAEQFSAQLILINVVTPHFPVGAPGVPAGYKAEEYYQELMNHANQTMKTIAKERIPAGVETKWFVERGDAVEEIIARAEKETIDLIVVAPHGWSGWRKWVFGSVANKVANLATCPVLIISERKEN